MFSKIKHVRDLLNKTSELKYFRSISLSANKQQNNLSNNNISFRENFATRHIGVSENEEQQMLKILNVKTLDELVLKTVPKNIFFNRELNLSEPLTEQEYLTYAKQVASLNKIYRSYIGMGYYNCHVPTVIQRNIFENPGWVTQYTPYQAELSQGRLESLLNYQTMICELTGLDISNASLLDEATAAAEAMTMCTRSNKRKKFLVSNKMHPQTIDLVKTRAEPLDIEIILSDLNSIDFSQKDISGVLFQYPNTGNYLIRIYI